MTHHSICSFGYILVRYSLNFKSVLHFFFLSTIWARDWCVFKNIITFFMGRGMGSGLHWNVSSHFCCLWTPERHERVIALPKTAAFKKHGYLLNFIENLIITTTIPIITFIVVIVATTITIVRLRRAQALRMKPASSTMTISVLSSAQVRHAALAQPARVKWPGIGHGLQPF